MAAVVGGRSRGWLERGRFEGFWMGWDLDRTEYGVEAACGEVAVVVVAAADVVVVAAGVVVVVAVVVVVGDGVVGGVVVADEAAEEAVVDSAAVVGGVELMAAGDSVGDVDIQLVVDDAHNEMEGLGVDSCNTPVKDETDNGLG